MREMLVHGKHAGGHANVSNHKAQVRTKYMLLQSLACALGCEPWAVPRPNRTQSTEVIHAKIKPMLKATGRWPGVINTIKQHIAKAGATAVANAADPPPGPLSGPQEAQLRALKLLDGAQRSKSESDYYTIETNIQHVAFMVHWHATVSRCLHLLDLCALNNHPVAQRSIPI